MKVFAVEQGQYSDYRVCGLFSTQKKAEEYIEALEWAEGGYDKPRIQEMKVDDPANTKSVIVWMFEDGGVDHTSKTAEHKPGFYAAIKNWKTNQFKMGWVVQTDEEERAVKVVNEKRTQAIAAGVWGDKDKMEDFFKPKKVDKKAKKDG